MTLYADVLFLINFLVNTQIMYFSLKLSGLKIRFSKILASGAIGAVYAVMVFVFKDSNLDNFIVKLAVSELMVLIANEKITVKNNIFCIMMMYVISFVCSGAVMAMAYLNGGDVFTGVKYAYLLCALIISALTVYCFLHIKSRRVGRTFEKITIGLNGKNIKLCALVDTGNMLCEPISGVPVVIVEADQLSDAITDFNSLRLRYIPYRALGNESDMLTGFVPDSFEVCGHKVNCCVAMYSGKLSPRSEYSALISPQLCSFERERVNE